MKKITISGPAGAGKGTIARAFAEKYEFEYVDLGLLFRVAAYGVENEGKKILDTLKELYQRGDIVYSWTGKQVSVFFKGENVTSELASNEIAQATAYISFVPENISRLIAFSEFVLESKTDVICDGRNAGTAILPHTPFKFYATADAEERAKRRLQDLKRLGLNADFSHILQQIQERDQLDTERASNPLRIPEGATILDTGILSVEQSVDTIWKKVSSF
jgi:CMP/dCMP kinase